MGIRNILRVLLPIMVVAACSAGCCMKCLKVKDVPATGPAAQIQVGDVLFKAAVLSNGTPVDIAVKDYCPDGDGVNEIAVPSSQSGGGTGGAGPTYASIDFPQTAFGDGSRKVTMTACHHNRLELRAYDRYGALVATAAHPGPQHVSKALTLTGGRISRIDIIGAEIGIDEVCYRK